MNTKQQSIGDSNITKSWESTSCKIQHRLSHNILRAKAWKLGVVEGAKAGFGSEREPRDTWEEENFSVSTELRLKRNALMM